MSEFQVECLQKSHFFITIELLAASFLWIDRLDGGIVCLNKELFIDIHFIELIRLACGIPRANIAKCSFQQFIFIVSTLVRENVDHNNM